MGKHRIRALIALAAAISICPLAVPQTSPGKNWAAKLRVVAGHVSLRISESDQAIRKLPPGFVGYVYPGNHISVPPGATVDLSYRYLGTTERLTRTPGWFPVKHRFTLGQQRTIERVREIDDSLSKGDDLAVLHLPRDGSVLPACAFYMEVPEGLAKFSVRLLPDGQLDPVSLSLEPGDLTKISPEMLESLQLTDVRRPIQVEYPIRTVYLLSKLEEESLKAKLSRLEAEQDVAVRSLLRAQALLEAGCLDAAVAEARLMYRALGTSRF